MNKIVLWLSFLLISFFSVSIVSAEEKVQLNPVADITIELTHEVNTFEGTTFSVYGISRKSYEYALSKKYETSIEKTKKWLTDQNIQKLKEVRVSSSNKVSFDLPKYNEQKELMYYIILQNSPDQEGENGEELFESFPSFISLDGYDDDVLPIQTKRVFISQLPYFFKYSSGKNPQALSDAEFVLYRINEFGEQEYLIDIETLDFSKSMSNQGAYTVKSDKEGLVILPTMDLPVGTYYFEETKAPNGFEIIPSSKKVEFIISDDVSGQRYLSINGEILEDFQAGELSQEVIKKGVPRVLNDPLNDSPGKEEPPKEDPPKVNPTEKEPPRKGFLPKTGESITAISSLGLLIMFVAFNLMKRGKENE